MGISLDRLGEASHCPRDLATRAGSKQPRFGITKPGHDPLLPIELGVDAGRIEREVTEALAQGLEPWGSGQG